MTMRTRGKKVDEKTFLGYYAGFVTRLFAFIIDTVLVTTFVSLVGLSLSLILRFFNIHLLDVMGDFYWRGGLLRSVVIFVSGFGFTFLVALIYHTTFWTLAGKTLGKALMGIRVIGPKGAPLSFGRALRRYLGYWLSAIPLFLGYFWVLITDERAAWHDLFAGTRVIYDHEARYGKLFLSRFRPSAPAEDEA